MEAMDILREKGIARVGPFRVPRTMSNTVSACLATPFRIKGLSYFHRLCLRQQRALHRPGHGADPHGQPGHRLRRGRRRRRWSQSYLFDAMGALSSQHNDNPEKASRPYDTRRDGFVISAGGGMVVVEALDHALARGARIHAEIIGYGATSDGYDMVAPSGESGMRCMQQALARVEEPIDYIEAHGTSTPVGDLAEMRAIRKVFGRQMPPISSTKSLSGHALGAAGVHEAIYCMLMMRENFIAGSANIDNLDPELTDMPVVREARSGVKLNTVMSNSFGFGGTNATLVLKRWED